MANENKRHPGRPKKTDWENCKVEGCDSTVEKGGFGMCRTHYMQVRRGMRAEDGSPLRQPERVRSYGDGARCTEEECGNRPKAHGLCNKHLMRALHSGSVHPQLTKTQYTASSRCLFEGCTNRPVNKGMCSTHAQQRLAGIIDESGAVLRDKKTCFRTRADRWVGGNGYVLVKAPEGHPLARVDGSILEHRLVMEQQMGRVLHEYEIVHHRDGNRGNNSPENLELLDGRSRAGKGHPPAHDIDVLASVQVLLQQDDISPALREGLEQYKIQRLV